MMFGCKSAHSLKRTPAPRKRSTVKMQQKKVNTAPQPKAIRRKNNNDDPLFEAIFHRNPQQLDKDSKMTIEEQRLLRRGDISKDPAVKRVYQQGQRDRNRSSDWVFGTKNGSFF